jgi:putative flippase GtrA
VLTVLDKLFGLLKHRAAGLPPFVRFGFVGCAGLFSDTLAFTALCMFGWHPFVARLMSLAFATLVTWTLNRRITFDKQPRRVGNEASRYVLVTLVAQGLSYSVFVTLITIFPHVLHQISLVAGAVAGAVLSFNGHKLVSFGPVAKHVS